MFESWPTADLIQLVANGAGLTLNAERRPTIDLVQIAANAGRVGARIIFRGMGGRTKQDLIQIAANGKGCVSFE